MDTNSDTRLPAGWSLLDNPLDWAGFSRPAPGAPACQRSSVVIGGMWCAACALKIEDALRATPGVQEAQVSAASGRASVVWSPDVLRPSDWAAVIQRLGYSALPANDTRALEKRRREGRRALWRWLVAGLCMMQVMMYAYPAYIARTGDLSAEMEHLLRWASWVLTLPVMLFSCGPFFRGAWRDLVKGRVGMDLPVALGVAITFAVSSAGTFEPQGIFGREVFFDSLTMFVFFLLTGRWLEHRMRDRTAGALEVAMNRLPDAVQRVRDDGGVETVAPRQLALGDTIRVLPGQAFAADGEVVLGTTRVDESLLTGESNPLLRGPGMRVVAGSHNLSSPVHVRVHGVGDQTRFAQIVALMQDASVSKPRLALLADRVATPFLMFVLLAAAVACAYWWNSDPQHALMVAVAVLIVTCPCALSLATPAAMLAGAGSMANAGVLVHRLQALEALASVDSVVFDKTGTLTSDVLEVRVKRARTGLSPSGALAMAGVLATHSLHPVAAAITKACTLATEESAWTAEDIREHAGQGIEGVLLPANPALLPRRARLGSAAFCGLARNGDGPAQTYLCDDDGWLATFDLQQQVRPDARDAIQALLRDGIAVHLLSGDRGDAARRVAGQLGISHVRFGCSPDEKLAYLYQRRAEGHRVAMVGDGLNDAPVLAAADVSFAFGRAVPLLQSHADFVVPGERLAPVVQTLRLARRTMRVVRQNLGWALVYNLACVPMAVLGWLPAWLAGLGMAASSLLVVLNALRLSGSMPALETS